MNENKQWLIEQLVSYPVLGEKTNVVFSIAWRLNGTDGVNTATVYGSLNVTFDPEAPYTPYDQLTNDQIIGWVKSELGEELVLAYEANINAQLYNLANPTQVVLPLPWTISNDIVA